ncbi:MAG: RHS repeat-associated core domain-containing protein, partial [Pyrinomonadaceae bacterium]
RYIYDGQDVLLDLNASGSIQTSYLNDLGLDNHLRQTSATTGVSYFLSDHLGSTSGLTDSSGNLVEQVAYDSFGNSTGSTRTRYGYTGRERDPDTALLYNRARFYDPQAGRFISEDPLGLAGGLNKYAYLDNRPMLDVDPFGLQRLAPLGRNGRARIEINRGELERKMTPRGGQLPEEVKKRLNEGCIGLCNSYQGYGDIYPETAPGTQCYLQESLARSRKCPRCCRNFVFAKQGDWNPIWRGSTPKPDPKNGRIPNDSIWNGKNGGHYNYVVYFPSTHSYAWMNYNSDQAKYLGPQIAYIQDSPPYLSDYPNTMWCSTCKKIAGR